MYVYVYEYGSEAKNVPSYTHISQQNQRVGMPIRQVHSKSASSPSHKLCYVFRQFSTMD